jgi:Ca2+-binding RTX toxin-like protein
MTGTVVVNSNFTLAAGQAAVFSSPSYAPSGATQVYTAGYLLRPVGAFVTAQPITFNAAGDINVSDNIWAGVSGIEDIDSAADAATAAAFAAGSWATIASTGTLTVTEMTPPSGPNSSTTATGYDSAWGYVSFENDGTVTVTTSGGTAYGVNMGRSLTANGPGVPLVPPGPNPMVVNTGTIQVTGLYGAGVALGLGCTLTNSGSITTWGGAEGVMAGSFGVSQGVITITNSGHITAGGTSPSVGIGSSSSGGTVNITNSGTITADHAIEIFASPPGGAALQLHNTGTINGSILTHLSPSANQGTFQGAQITNAGAINGDVQLLDGGNDLYDGRGGTLSGTLSLGGGLNIVHLGNDGETVHTGIVAIPGLPVSNSGGGLNIMYGGAGADTLVGGSSIDTFVVGGGNDVLDGGAGFNTVSYIAATSGVTVSLGITVSQNTGFGADTLTNFQELVGSAFSDHLTGGPGNDIIDAGPGGNDVMDGGGGYNSASFQYAPNGVTVSLALQGAPQATGIGNDTLINFQGLVGSRYADHLTGGPGGNSLISGGTGGDDVLDGGGGVNNMASFAYSTAGVTVSLMLQGAPQATGVGNVTLTNFQNLGGSAYNDTLEGNSGNNILDGGGGTNTVTYAHATSGVTVSLALQGSGQNTVGAGIDTLNNFQNLTGSAFNDILEGNSGNNVLDGGGGTNTVSYAHAGAGVTVSLGLQGQAQNTVGAGTDTLWNFQALVGSAYGDTLEGGGPPSTSLTGGLGADTFVYRSGDGAVTVTDFSHAQGDKIDLSNIGAFAGLSDLLATTSQVGPDTVISLGGGSLTLKNVSMGSLTASDLKFFTPLVGPGIGGVPVQGPPSGGTLTGGTGPDWLVGQGGNDILHGGGGSDYLDGGGGFNTATYNGVYRQYAVWRNGGVVTGGPEGASDTLVNIQRIQFVDGYLATSPTDTAGQVYRIYEATLNRAPDQGGLTNWVNSLNGGTSLQTVVNGFVGSQEFQTVYGALDNAGFVTLLYNNVLHRAPDAGGLANWVGFLTSGAMTRAQVVLGFSESAEDIAALAAPVQQGLWVGDPSAAQVARLYDTVLAREPDSGGLANWTHMLETGTSLQTVANGFVGSQEFQSVYGTLDNNGFVTLLYANVLHRAPDSQGLANWVNALSSGQDTRAQVVAGFSESLEHISNLAPHIDSGIWVTG